MLDEHRIAAAAGLANGVIRVEAAVDSTNSSLARCREAGEPVRVLLAEHQSAGRGRHGRRWLSPPGRGLYLSMAWSFQQPPRELGALSLTAGLAAAEAIERQVAVRVGLKWPNDLQIDGRKLGGCLVDLATGRNGATNAIIGIGINVDFRGLDGPDQPWTDLAAHAGRIDRNRLAADLIQGLDRELDRFNQAGFAAVAERWRGRDVLFGRDLVLIKPGQANLDGRGAGVDAHGGLVVETDQGRRIVRSGEVSQRIRTHGT